MADTGKKVLVIIVTYNGMKWLKECLESVMNSTIPADLFIVDNGSTDGSIDFIKTNYPEAKLIESKENLGFGKANNLGFEHALKNGYDYVYLLNQDAWVEPDLLEKMIAVSKANPEYGILSPLQVNREKTKLDYNFVLCVPQALSSDLLCRQTLQDVYECNFAMAAHWLITKKCLLTVGGFSPAFPHYGEDNNYVNRTVYKGYKIGIVPECKGVHDRENRADSLNKLRYLQFIHQLVLYNNLSKNHYFWRGGKKLVALLISSPKYFPWKYLRKITLGYFHSTHFRKESKKDRAFLNLNC